MSALTVGVGPARLAGEALPRLLSPLALRPCSKPNQGSSDSGAVPLTLLLCCFPFAKSLSRPCWEILKK